MKNRNNILLATSIGHFLVHCITLVFPAILIILRDDFQVSLIQLGELGTIQFGFFGLASIPAGWLVDRFGSKNVLLTYFFGTVLSVICISTSHSFSQLAFGLGLLGLFSGLYHPAGLNLVSHTKNISQNMAYHGISGSLGLTFGPIIGAGISAIIDWKIAYIILAILALIGGIFTFLQLKLDKPAGPPSKHYRFKLSQTHYVILAVASIWGFAHHGLFNYLPIYFSEAVNWNIDDVVTGGMLTAFVLILGVLGQIIGGKLGANIPRKKLLVWVVGLNIPFLLLMGYSTGVLLILIVGVLGAVNFTFQPVNNSLIADVTPKGNRGMVYGLSMGVGYGVGSLAATVGGYIGENYQLSSIFPFLAIVLVPGVLLALFLSKE
ncbi:MAG: MFS transporter [Candidatus Marinimicrobia bacterium]|nr:MFS transporter [Candidatus Neomarinimicrobiota bacterium]MBL7023264.1 MFS transporter [Candidatus Neomarinimicrobiota bacterium]MBL7108858.1 MFS transporter [Candidatus Neomarinimicrobiota bacterium]